MMAWQLDGVGYNQESITLIAHDEKGMEEAIGTFYQAIAGQEPLTKWALPASVTITPAKTAPGTYPAAKILRTIHLLDRVEAIGIDGDDLKALCHDGSVSRIAKKGAVEKLVSVAKPDEMEKIRNDLLASAKPAPEDVTKKQLRPDRLQKLAVQNADFLAVAYWGGTLRIADKTGTVKFEQQLPQDPTALVWMNNGHLNVGLADGTVLVLEVK